MYSELAWVPVSSGSLRELKFNSTLDPNYLPDYLSVYHDLLSSRSLGFKKMESSTYYKTLFTPKNVT